MATCTDDPWRGDNYRPGLTNNRLRCPWCGTVAQARVIVGRVNDVHCRNCGLRFDRREGSLRREGA